MSLLLGLGDIPHHHFHVGHIIVADDETLGPRRFFIVLPRVSLPIYLAAIVLRVVAAFLICQELAPRGETWCDCDTPRQSGRGPVLPLLPLRVTV